MAWCWCNATESKPQNVVGNTRATRNAEKNRIKKTYKIQNKQKSFAEAKLFLFLREKFIEIVTEKSCAKIENRTELCR